MRPAIQAICEEVSSHFGYVTLDDITSRSRTKSVAEARAVAMWLAREKLGLSYPELGREFGRDHTSCITAVRKVCAAKGMLRLTALRLSAAMAVSGLPVVELPSAAE